MVEQDRTSENLPPTKIVVAAVIFNSERNAVLVGQRAEKITFPLEWEFIGGKVEEGEELNTAIIREIQEELNVEIDPIKILDVLEHDFAENTMRVRVHFIECKPVGDMILDGNFEFHEKVEWVKLEELSSLNFIGSDGEFARRLIFNFTG